ncbi:MAG: hypothetical protein AABO57_19690 [Acidobacteriota bacterium]
MKGCNYIKERIDEADKPNLLSFEVTEHIAQCDDCDRFARERTALRELVASGARVNAPINFDAMLNSRLAEVKARRSFWWLGSPGLLRLGAATAGLVIMIFAAQYTGLFSDQSNRGQQAQNGAGVSPTLEKALPPSAPPPEINTGPNRDLSNHGGREETVAYASPGGNVRTRRGDVAVSRITPSAYVTAEDGGVVLVRGQNGDMDVQMPTVSVGAQPLLFVRAGQRAVRDIGTSF